MDPVLIEKLVGAYDSGEGSAIATIIKSWGSTPRKAGAKMLITDSGSVAGTVGGGSGEALVMREALLAITRRKPANIRINMTNDVAADEGMVCGGEMEVFIDIINQGDSAAREIYGQLLESIKTGRSGVLFTIISDREMAQALVGKKMFISNEKTASEHLPDDIKGLIKSIYSKEKGCTGPETVKCTAGRLELLAEPVSFPAELLILGGGHIAVPLARMADILGYRYKIVDDRPEFADRERFPGAGEVICQNFEKALKDIDIGPNTSVVIVTRGHTHDRLCLKWALQKQALYIGMIGSRRKVKGVLDGLRDEGAVEESLKSVYSPVGLDIGAETPEEIALSIISEIVAVRRGGEGRSLKLLRGF